MSTAALKAVFASVLIFLCISSAAAQDATEESPSLTDQMEDVFVAPVVIDGDVLFVVRGSSALPADERAETIQQRIIDIAESSEAEAITLTTRDMEFGKAISIDGTMVSVVTSADAELEQMDIEVLADLQSVAIEEAVLTYRRDRSDAARVESALAAMGWTVAFLIFTVLFFWRRGALVDGGARLAERQFSQVEEATASIVRGKALAGLARYGLQVLMWVLFFVVLYYYLSFVLLSFAETRVVAEVLLTYVTDPLINIFTGFVGYLPNLVTLVIIVVVTRYIVTGLKVFFENIDAGTIELKEFERHWVQPTFNIARVVVILVALVFAYPYIPGSDSAAFQGLTILAGVMVSLGSNTVVSNMMAGLFVIYRRSTNLGDRIKVGDQIGDVVEIKLMETLLKSVKNEMISIPNSQLLNSEVVNYSRRIDGRGLLVHTTVGIGYEEPPEKVQAMLIEAARRTNGLKQSPDPFVLWTALADYAINYQINAFTTRGASLPKIQSDLRRHIVEVFNENETQIMTPSYVADPDVPKIPAGHWDGTLATPAGKEA
ncbi:MAG: mechanosensitive ion channel family protein [Pseudomonadota bacterium]